MASDELRFATVNVEIDKRLTRPAGSLILQRNAETAREVERILGLPGPNWTGVHIEFGTDEPATAEVTFFITREQLQLLVAAAVNVGGGR